MPETEYGFRKWKQSNQILNSTDAQKEEELGIELRKRSIRQDNGGTFSDGDTYPRDPTLPQKLTS